MVCALFVGSFWQLFASYMELNVSATHSISEAPSEQPSFKSTPVFEIAASYSILCC